jgi:methionine aminotransferase
MKGFRSKLPNVGTTIFTVMSALSDRHNAINLSQGFPDFDCPARLKDLVKHYMDKGLNQYAPMAGVPDLIDQIGRKIELFYDRNVDPAKEITITSGATQALFTVITTLIHEGDEAIIIEPAYDSYIPDVQVNGGKPRIYSLKPPEFKIDWDSFRSLINAKTKLIVVNTPHNPIGRIWERSDMLELEKIVTDHNLYVVSDEVYEHITYDGQAHESILKYPGIYEKGFAVFSFGKTFHNTGWKIGYCVARPELTEEFRKIHQFNVFSLNTPIQYALADFMSEVDYKSTVTEFYERKRDFFLQQMKKTHFLPLECQGTYFCLFDYTKVSDKNDLDFVKWLTAEQKVAAIPLSVFYSDQRQEGLIRFCFAKQESTLEKAVDRLTSINLK